MRRALFGLTCLVGAATAIGVGMKAGKAYQEYDLRAKVLGRRRVIKADTTDDRMPLTSTYSYDTREGLYDVVTRSFAFNDRTLLQVKNEGTLPFYFYMPSERDEKLLVRPGQVVDVSSAPRKPREGLGRCSECIDGALLFDERDRYVGAMTLTLYSPAEE